MVRPIDVSWNNCCSFVNDSVDDLPFLTKNLRRHFCSSTFAKFNCRHNVTDHAWLQLRTKWAKLSYCGICVFFLKRFSVASSSSTLEPNFFKRFSPMDRGSCGDAEAMLLVALLSYAVKLRRKNQLFTPSALAPRGSRICSRCFHQWIEGNVGSLPVCDS